jgi:hypothetical protein
MRVDSKIPSPSRSRTMPRFLPAADELPPYKRLLSGEDGRKAVIGHW